MIDREQFRLDRVARMQDVSDDLFGAIDEALTSGLTGEEFADAMEEPIRRAFLAEYEGAADEFAIYDTPLEALGWFATRIRAGLEKVDAQSQARRVADWLGTAIVNGARVLASESESGKEWVSRRDDKVRPFHVEADGQVVAWDEPFVVCGGTEMAFPGDPVGDPECWINCRCVVTAAPLRDRGSFAQHSAVEAEVFAANPESTGKVIVAIPAADDPIWNASSEPTPHMTMIWLGKQEFSEEDWRSILSGVRYAAEGFGDLEGPQELAVTGRELLGDDDADVAMVDAGKMANLRDYMLTHETIRRAYEAAEQFPQWTPHVTLGYPDTPATGDPGETIRFDRLAVWDGDYEGEEYPMSTISEQEVLDEEFTVEAAEAVPWYAVFAPEGVWSGDKRRFAEGALTWRDLPIPLMWQERSGMGHDGSVQVGSASHMWRDEASGTVRAIGTFADTDSSDQVIGLVAERHLRGVSVDVDAAEMALEEDQESVTFSRGRVSAATIVAIPAFQEAFIGLGAPPEDWDVPAHNLVSDGQFRDYTAEERDRMAEDGRALPDGSFPIADEEDLRNAIQAIGRASDPAKAKAHIVKRARALGKGDLIPEQWAGDTAFADAPGLLKDGSPPQCSYCKDRATGYVLHTEGMAFVPFCDAHQQDAIGDAEKCTPDGTSDPSNVDAVRRYAVAASATEFKRGPGWVTDPVATKRIHDYWTRPGEEGYAKIGWGTPGDFRRLRAVLAKYVEPRFLNRTAAQWHYDALGYWPGEKGKPGNPMSLGAPSPALHLVAAVGLSDLQEGKRALPPAHWFADPSLSALTALTVTDEGRVFGHLAGFGTCHIGIPGTCTTAPHSESSYAYYMTGAVQTDDGQTVAVGQITLGTGHASTAPTVTARQAAAHYDNTGTVVADVRAGEDAFGIWVAGAVRPSATEEQRHALRAGALSGDWRSIGGSLELVAALVVNVPGFPVPRVGLAASGGIQSALVAAGLVLPDSGGADEVASAVNDLVRLAADEVEARMGRRARAAAVLEAVRPFRVAAMVHDVEV